MPPFLLGLAVARGAPTPVLDAAKLVGAVGDAPAGRFVTLRVGERRVILAVDEVIGLRELAAASLHELPPLLRDATGDGVAQVGELDAELLLVLDAARVLPETLLSALESAQNAS